MDLVPLFLFPPRAKRDPTQPFFCPYLLRANGTVVHLTDRPTTVPLL